MTCRTPRPSSSAGSLLQKLNSSLVPVSRVNHRGFLRVIMFPLTSSSRNNSKALSSQQVLDGHQEGLKHEARVNSCPRGKVGNWRTCFVVIKGCPDTTEVGGGCYKAGTKMSEGKSSICEVCAPLRILVSLLFSGATFYLASWLRPLPSELSTVLWSKPTTYNVAECPSGTICSPHFMFMQHQHKALSANREKRTRGSNIGCFVLSPRTCDSSLN